jgi:aryl-alcohol dehydrogenase-like predicted oxidoreductase
VAISVKFGALRGPDGAWLGYDARPQAVKAFAAYSLKRLGAEVIDIYRPARVDPNVPIEETIGAIAELVKAGYVRHIGCPRPGRRPSAAPPQSTRSPTCRSSIPCSRAGSRAGSCRPAASSASASPPMACCRAADQRAFPGHRRRGDFRGHSPRFQGENLARNLSLVEALRAVAAAKGVERRADRDRLGALARRGHRAAGRRAPARPLAESLGALDVALTPDDLAAIERAVPPGAAAGERYAPAQMAMLDSERAA